VWHLPIKKRIYKEDSCLRRNDRLLDERNLKPLSGKERKLVHISMLLMDTNTSK